MANTPAAGPRPGGTELPRRSSNTKAAPMMNPSMNAIDGGNRRLRFRLKHDVSIFVLCSEARWFYVDEHVEDGKVRLQ